MSSNFNPITITDLDEHQSYNPDKSKPLFNMYLILSEAPTYDWENIFGNIWDRTFYSMKRRAWVEGDYLVIYCVPEEIEKYHLQKLKDAVRETNDKYQEYLEIEKRREKEKDGEEQNEQDRLNSIKDRLNFD